MPFINPAIPVVGRSLFDVPVVVKEVKPFCPYCMLEWQDWTWAESSFDGTVAYRREVSRCKVCGNSVERIVNEVRV